MKKDGLNATWASWRLIWTQKMTRKEKILRAIEEMPDDVSIDNAIGKLILLENGEDGEMFSQKDLQARLKSHYSCERIEENFIGKAIWILWGVIS